MAVAVLVLQAFSGEGGASGGASQQESAASHVACGPDQVADSLHAEHGVVDEEGDGVDGVGAVGGAGGDEGGHGACFGDAFFEDLAVAGFFVVEQGVAVDGFVELSGMGVDAHFAEEGFHAEGAGFVGHDGHDQAAQAGVAQQFGNDADGRHGGGNGAVFGSFEEFFEEGAGRGGQGFACGAARWQEAAEFFAARLQVLHFGAVVGRSVEWGQRDVFVGDGNAEAGAEFAEFVFVQFFLLVGDVAAFAGFAESVAFDGFCEDDGGGSGVVYRFEVCGVHFFGIVSAAAQAAQLFVGQAFGEFFEARVAAEEVAADVGAGFDDVFLVLPVHGFAHSSCERSVRVFGEQGVPIAAPDDFDDVPAGSAKEGF